MSTITLRSTVDRQSIVENQECSIDCNICLGTLFDKQPGSMLTRVHSGASGQSIQNTDHVFHRTCIEAWAKSTQDNHDKCPLCRQDYGRVEHYKYNEEAGDYVQVEQSPLASIGRLAWPLSQKEKIRVISFLFFGCLSLALPVFLFAFAQSLRGIEKIGVISASVGLAYLNSWSIQFLAVKLEV